MVGQRLCDIREAIGPARERRWWRPARARTLALLAQLVIVVEAGEHPCELACAHIARHEAGTVAAVPGRVSSPASKGTNALLMGGAQLVRSPQDALDLLYGVRDADGRRAREQASASSSSPDLRTVLEQVGARQGHDGAKLTARGCEPDEIALALAELELTGTAGAWRRGTLRLAE